MQLQNDLLLEEQQSARNQVKEPPVG